MASAPAVSVVIPTRDRWRLVSRTALPAALGQQGVELEVVVVDDGSRDETPEGLARLAAADRRVRFLRHDRSHGVAAARNAGVAAAQGTWVAFLDDDDVWSPRKLALQLGAAERNGAVWVYSGAIAVDERGRPLYEYYFPEPALVARQLLTSAVVPAGASNVVARTDDVRRLGGFDEHLSMLADWDLWIRLAEAATPTALREVLVAVLFHSSSGHAVNDQADELEQLILKHAACTPPRRLDVDVLGHGRWIASEHSRAGMHRRAAWLYARDAFRFRSPTNLARAADALLGKRLSRAAIPRGRREARAPVVAPDWLSSWPRLDEAAAR